MFVVNIGMLKVVEIFVFCCKFCQIKVGKVFVGGDVFVSVQLMCIILIMNINVILQQIVELIVLGCDIVCVVVLSQDDVDVFYIIVKKSQILVIVDIYFQLKYVFQVIDVGCVVVCVNLGNICKFDDQVGVIVVVVKVVGVSL